jgi:hypothetical protein
VRLLCPACRKLNEPVVLPSATCSRCGCDLSTLCAIRAAAARSLPAAARALHRRDWATALEHAGHSWSLLNSPDAARLAALACGALGQIEELLTWRHRVTTVKHE